MSPLDERDHILAHHVAVAPRVVQCSATKRILEERIEVVVEAGGYELDVAALDGVHERRDTGVGDSIDINGLDLCKDFEVVQLSCAAGEVQRCAANFILGVEVGVQREQRTELFAVDSGGRVHKEVYTAVHDRVVDREPVLHKLENRFQIFLVQRLVDYLFGTCHSFSLGILDHL